MHLESTKLMVDEFARAVLPWGTTTVVVDPHEIANVFGLRGVSALAGGAAPGIFLSGAPLLCAAACAVGLSRRAGSL